MRRYLIYAMVYGTIGVCVGLAMAYVSKDGQPYFSIVPKPRRNNMVDLPQTEAKEEVTEEVEISE